MINKIFHCITVGGGGGEQNITLHYREGWGGEQHITLHYSEGWGGEQNITLHYSEGWGGELPNRFLRRHQQCQDNMQPAGDKPVNAIN